MAKSRFVGALLLVAFACQAQSNAPGVHPVSGRRFAQVMGPGGADWLVRPERIEEEEPDKALDAIGLEPGQTVADLGAGVGYMTWRMAKRVGPQGTVYGQDIQPYMLEQLQKNMRERGITNVKTVLGGLTDTKLPAASLDLLLMVDVYHEMQNPQVFLQKLRPVFKPGGRLVLVEFRKEDPNVPILAVHKMSVAEVKLELEAEGFVLDKVIGVLPWQHIIVLRVK
jgi:ubiquinone/menaquinone biosynthesis C-methylase UbiE